MEKGTLFGVSVGPGDPELLTCKALRVIRQCPVIAVPRTKGKNTLALDIVRQAVPLEGKELLYLDHRMVSDVRILRRQYQENARLLMEKLAQGMSIALLNLGDVSVYSTCSHMMEEVKAAGYPWEMIPGVTSFCACAAVTGQSLTYADQPLHIFPGSYEDIDGALEAAGGKVLMKPASALPQIREKILRRGLQEKCQIVSDCGLPTQKVGSISEDDITSYFTTILIQP